MKYLIVVAVLICVGCDCGIVDKEELTDGLVHAGDIEKIEFTTVPGKNSIWEVNDNLQSIEIRLEKLEIAFKQMNCEHTNFKYKVEEVELITINRNTMLLPDEYKKTCGICGFETQLTEDEYNKEMFEKYKELVKGEEKIKQDSKRFEVIE